MKDKIITLRLSEEEQKMLIEVNKYLNECNPQGYRSLNQSDVIRYLIWDMYQEATNK